MEKSRVILLIISMLILLTISMGMLISQQQSADEFISTVNKGIVIDKEVSDVTPLFNKLLGSQEIRYTLVVKVSDSESGKTVCRTISVSEQAYLENDIGDYLDDLNSIKEKA